jgi:exosortase
MVRIAVACVLWTLALLVSWSAFTAAAHLALFDDRYVPVAAAPLIGLTLFCWLRKRILRDATWDFAGGLPLIAITLALSLLARRYSPVAGSIRLSVEMLSLMLTGAAVFVLCFGRKSFRAAVFPLCCLLLAVPAPPWVMDRVAAFLQHAAAVMSYQMIRIVGVPIFAHDQNLVLPNLEIEVAPECSGIRSCLALVLVTLLAGRLSLASGWSRLTLVVASVPLAILKNSLRISVIALLGAYVNHAFVESPIHRYGGLIFTPLEIAALAWILKKLRGLDAAGADNSTAGPGSVFELSEGLTAPQS